MIIEPGLSCVLLIDPCARVIFPSSRIEPTEKGAVVTSYVQVRLPDLERMAKSPVVGLAEPLQLVVVLQLPLVSVQLRVVAWEMSGTLTTATAATKAARRRKRSAERSMIPSKTPRKATKSAAGMSAETQSTVKDILPHRSKTFSTSGPFVTSMERSEVEIF